MYNKPLNLLLFYPERLEKHRLHAIECAIIDQDDEAAHVAATELLEVICAALDEPIFGRIEKPSIGGAVLVIYYEAFRPDRLFFGACEVANAITAYTGEFIEPVGAHVSIVC